ncbi:TraM recognition domain-containing protein [Tahibacter amnicola]|uniref:TraM recognition domain-containing protein n=1 Tax=Tahibacter amnicola TaxID=2976241 RepID=A0ABY6BE69_9GAMM|nr:TraM recognition domain-containing protein [Tahibacter amnicola]UXI68329.1 TraM recognition domain-containing protein [Tahibacter amnicola]
MPHYKGASRAHEVNASRRRRDTRRLGQKFRDFLDSADGIVAGLVALPIAAVLLIKVPFSGELILLIAWLFYRRAISTRRRAFDFPYRAPMHAGLRDGSAKDGKAFGEGITYIGFDQETRDQIYAGNSDLRTHMLVLGTTGSGKTEFLLGLVFNALVQNTGCIYVDGKGDPKLQKEMFRLARYLGREDDLLLVNFITSGRDFIDKQPDKVTNTLNLMANTSSGMLIELIVSLMDDAGGDGMWKGRAIMFVAALTRPLVFLRDKGFINLSPDKYLEYFELHVIETLVWEHDGRYGEGFDAIVAPLRSYLLTLPGYQRGKVKKQEQKTLEQHGFIVMQLTRIFNDLSFNYGHIFKTRGGGDVDFYDVVLNRRILVVLLPALERAPDSLRMLGKMIVGSIKQMMAGCLGNRVEGAVREIIDSRPTNATTPFYCILDEYGYYAVLGFAVAPAQARSLGFSVIFAAQDFSSLKKSSAEEADATWENTNLRAIGRITSGQESETWRRIEGAAGQTQEAVVQGFDRKSGAFSDRLSQQDTIGIERRSRLDYDDLAMQENGEFHFLIGKKEKNGQGGGVRVIRGMGFYTAGPAPREIRINDLLPIEQPEADELPGGARIAQGILAALTDGSLPGAVRAALRPDHVLTGLRGVFRLADERLPQADASAAQAALGWFLAGAKPLPGAPVPPPAVRTENAAAPAPSPQKLTADEVLARLASGIVTVAASAGIVAGGDGWIRAHDPADVVVPVPGDIVERDRWLAVDLAARDRPYDSLEEKWMMEERCESVRDRLGGVDVPSGTRARAGSVPRRETVDGGGTGWS